MSRRKLVYGGPGDFLALAATSPELQRQHFAATNCTLATAQVRICRSKHRFAAKILLSCRRKSTEAIKTSLAAKKQLPVSFFLYRKNLQRIYSRNSELRRQTQRQYRYRSRTLSLQQQWTRKDPACALLAVNSYCAIRVYIIIPTSLLQLLANQMCRFVLYFAQAHTVSVVRDWNHPPVTATSAASLLSFRNQLGSIPYIL